MSVDGHIERFLTAVRELPELWNSLSTRTVAVRHEHRWLAVSTLCRLELRGARRRSSTRFLPSTTRVLAFEESVPIAALGDFLNDVAKGERQVDGKTVSYVRGLIWPSINSDGTPDPRTEGFNSGHFQPNAQVIIAAVPRPLVNVHLLEFNGDTSRNLLQWVAGSIETFDNELRSLPHPWDGLTHLIRSIGASLHAWMPDNNLSFHVVAPLGAALNVDRCELRSDRLRISVCAASRAAIRLSSVGFAGYDANKAQINGTSNTSRRKWQKDVDLWYYEAEVPMRRAEKVALFLRLKNATIQRIELEVVDRKPNLLCAANAIHHPKNDQAWVKTLLETRGTRAREFERAVAKVFAMLDLSVDFLGDDEDTDAADALVRLGRDHLLVVECTTSTLKGDGKLAKLVSRAARLREGLRGAQIDVNNGYRAPVDRALMHLTGRKMHDDVNVVPVIVSALPLDEISKGEIDDAQSDGVVVLSRDDLKYFLRVLAVDDDYHNTVAGIITGRLRVRLS